MNKILYLVIGYYKAIRKYGWENFELTVLQEDIEIGDHIMHKK